jgi:hypothetical protein
MLNKNDQELILIKTIRVFYEAPKEELLYGCKCWPSVGATAFMSHNKWSQFEERNYTESNRWMILDATFKITKMHIQTLLHSMYQDNSINPSVLPGI